MKTNAPRLARFALPALLLTSTLLYAGPLNPPAGPITSTGKTTQEVFDKVAETEPRIAINTTNTPGDADSLFKITQPGSYYLTANITGVVGKYGIEIAASGVTLDLNGFDLVGVPSMGAFDGVGVTVNSLTSIVVRNGSVRDWGDEGVDLGSFAALNSTVEDVRASGNTGNGISVGTASVVSGCSASSNGINGIDTAFGCVVTECTTFSNGNDGIFAHSSSTVSQSVSYLNTGIGIATGASCTISGCSTTDNNAGIQTSSGCVVSQSSAGYNATRGVTTGSGCHVVDCIVTNNILDGIQVLNDCTVRGNTCDSNGSGAGSGAGILVSGGDNVIEGNTCTDADRGIDVDAGGNLIIKNRCSGNTTNWDFVIGNAYGPIVATPSGAAVSGNTAAAVLGSTDPNANFTY
ncbi:MAG: right-handed parallel beta-helix repeat-containing protein [Phycisphaerales bacterium]